MTLPEAIPILETYNKWRRGADIPQPDPKEIGETIEIAINLMKGINK